MFVYAYKVDMPAYVLHIYNDIDLHLYFKKGSSGAGKSTLLDILAGRLVSASVSGQILANKRPVNFDTFRRQSGYVMQSDALFPLLTVKETLFYAAHLRIHGKTYEERQAAANEVMCLLRIDHRADTIVGDELNRGLSGMLLYTYVYTYIV